MEWTAVTHFLTGHWYLADVGNIQYCMWNTLHGRFMFSPLVSGNHFAYHFTPLLVPLAPITLLCQYPIPLVTLYTLALALCPVPIYMLARRRKLPQSVALGLGVLFLGNHFVGSIQLATHFEVFLILFFLCCMAARPGSAWFWAWAVLAITVKEDAPIWLGAWAAIQLWLARDKAYARLLALCGCYLAAAAAVLLLKHSAGQGASTYVTRSGGILVDLGTLKMAVLLLLSFGGLSLFAGRRALLLLVPVPLLLIRFGFIRELQYYYSYPFIPYLTFTAIYGAANLLGIMHRRWAGLMSALALALYCTAAGAVQFPLPTRTDDLRRSPLPVTSRDWYRLDVAGTFLPEDSRVAVQFGLWGVTPMHRGAISLSLPVPADAYAFLDLKAGYGMVRDDYIAVARSLVDDTQAGRRRMLHNSHDIMVFSPVDAHSSATVSHTGTK